jgi:predicted acyltransferase
MILVNTPGTWSHVYPPLLHADWHGYTPTDLIFPFFLFIVGISISFAYKNKPNTTETYKKIVVRSLKIIGLGLFLGWFLPYMPFFKPFSELRLPGVLQRIGVVFFIAAILNLNFNWKALLSIAVIILVGYWIWLGFIPLNGEPPTLDRAPNNWANYLDVKIFGNHTYKPDYDPEGLVSTLPAIVSAILGILIGKVLSDYKNNKLVVLSILGIGMIVLGTIWNYWFPINKALWSSSFVLVTAGWGTLILGIVHYIMDEKQIKFGTIFKYVGSNAIVIYFMSSFISKTFGRIKVNETESIHSWMYLKFYTNFISSDKLASMLYALTIVAFYMLLGYILYKRKIFIKV